MEGFEPQTLRSICLANSSRSLRVPISFSARISQHEAERQNYYRQNKKVVNLNPLAKISI